MAEKILPALVLGVFFQIQQRRFPLTNPREALALFLKVFGPSPFPMRPKAALPDASGSFVCCSSLPCAGWWNVALLSCSNPPEYREFFDDIEPPRGASPVCPEPYLERKFGKLNFFFMPFSR